MPQLNHAEIPPCGPWPLSPRPQLPYVQQQCRTCGDGVETCRPGHMAVLGNAMTSLDALTISARDISGVTRGCVLQPASARRRVAPTPLARRLLKEAAPVYGARRQAEVPSP